MFKNILVAADGSAEALGAATIAGRMAAASGGSVRVITVHEEPGSMLGEPDYTDTLHRTLAEADMRLAAAAAEVVAAGGPDPRKDRIAGHPAEGILATAAAGGHDLIVLGNRGRGRIAGAVLGSVSLAVASRAHVPVLIVPHVAG